jgi:glycosyltransferase involved in cell wall biosynthesis
MRILMLGLRAIGTHGGVETYTEMLTRHLIEIGHNVEIVARKPYRAVASPTPARVTWLWSTKGGALEAVGHGFVGVCYALMRRPDILHIHGLGAAFCVPFARLVGLRVVFTLHARDALRESWGPITRMGLRMAEWFGIRCANAACTVSTTMAREILEDHQRECTVVRPGTNSLALDTLNASELLTYGLSPNKYIITVGRLAPEKRQLDLIAAFKAAALEGFALVVVGAPDHWPHYTNQVRMQAAESPQIVLTGWKSGRELANLVAHARLFVLASSYEGMPIALLEAAGSGVDVLASDLSGHREIGLAADRLFEVGDRNALAKAILRICDGGPDRARIDRLAAHVQREFTWINAARAQSGVYELVAKRNPDAASVGLL